MYLWYNTEERQITLFAALYVNSILAMKYAVYKYEKISSSIWQFLNWVRRQQEKSIIKIFVHPEHLFFFYSTKVFLSFLSCHTVVSIVRNIKHTEVSFISVVSGHSDFSYACNAIRSTVSLYAFLVRWQEVFVFFPPFKWSLQCVKKFIFTCS